MSNIERGQIRWKSIHLVSCQAIGESEQLRHARPFLLAESRLSNRLHEKPYKDESAVT
jgi:hypothetical protein